MRKIFLVIICLYFSSCSYYTYTHSSGCAVAEYKDGYWGEWRNLSSSFAIATRNNEFVIYNTDKSRSPSDFYIKVHKGNEAGKENGWTVYQNCKIEYHYTDEITGLFPLTFWGRPEKNTRIAYGTVKIFHGKFENIIRGKTINVFVRGHKLSGCDGFGISPRTGSSW